MEIPRVAQCHFRLLLKGMAWYIPHRYPHGPAAQAPASSQATPTKDVFHSWYTYANSITTASQKYGNHGVLDILDMFEETSCIMWQDIN